MPRAYIIPEHVDPFRFAEQKAHLKGIIPFANLPRLCTSLSSAEGVVEVEVQFNVDEQDIPCLVAQLKTEVVLQCQRCLDPYKYEIITSFVSGVVRSEDKVSLMPSSYNPVVVQENNLALRDLIEDELILSLPIVPKHAPEECKVQMPYKDAGQENEKISPFHILKEPIKRKSEK